MNKKPIENLIKCFTVAFFILFVSCKKKNNLNFIENNTTIDSGFVRRVEKNRGILTLKNFAGDYYVYSWCPLIQNKSLPSWIKEKEVREISDIDAPYKIFKMKNENFFSIIKNADTLKFKIEDDKGSN
ncbi:hypothetical protein [Flavobacterium sp.]|uniref:hypothetical protein n=1 Tax=Flavobacterium sp. TaxID=239 RepID=UPI003D2821D4